MMDVELTAPKGITVKEAAEKISAALNPPVEEENQEQNAPPEEGTEDTSQTDSTPEVQTFKVRVDGEEIDVPLDELLKGYSRTSDYTRKTQKVAEERKALEAEAVQVKTERQQYSEALRLIESQLQQAPQVDWARLEQEDPIAYATAKLKERDRKDQLQLIQQEQHRVAYLQAEEQKKALEQYVQGEQARLADAIPEWKDAKVAKADKEKLTNYLVNLGYSEAEISQIYDHRAVVALRKAALYDEMMSKAKSTVEKVGNSPKTARPGNLQEQPANKSYLAAKQQLAQSGKITDFARAFSELSRKK